MDDKGLDDAQPGQTGAESSAAGVLTETEKIAQAVAEGYPDVDETCSDPECGRLFKNYHHFIRCDRRPCAMSDGKGTLFEQWAALDSERSGTVEHVTNDNGGKDDGR